MIVAPSRAQGYGFETQDGKITREVDSFTCAHCNFINFVKCWPPTAEEGGFCRACYLHICIACDTAGLKCVPTEKRIEAMESRDRFRKALGV